MKEVNLQGLWQAAFDMDLPQEGGLEAKQQATPPRTKEQHHNKIIETALASDIELSHSL